MATDEQLVNRREMYLDRISQVLTKEEHERACNILRGYTDQELLDFFVSMGKESAKHGELTLKDKLNNLKKIQNGIWERGKEPAARESLISFYSEEENAKYLDIIKRSHVQDYIQLTNKEDDFLIDLWEGPQDWGIDFANGETRGHILIPSDLFFAKTIPLTDCLIIIDERNDFPNGQICKHRVICFDNYAELIDKANQTEFEGLIETAVQVFYVGDIPAFFQVFGVCRGFDTLVCRSKIGFFPNAKLINPVTIGQISSMAGAWMETWYGIQIALLHPAVKDVFANPQRCREEETKNTDGKKRKRKVKYIRKHILTLDKLETVSNSKEARKINRKCLAWYVIGHWRTYKSGKKVFVMPYWKGVLRDLRKNMEGDERERQINFEWETGT